MEDHLRHLRVVLELLKDHKLVVNLKKCAFEKDRNRLFGSYCVNRGVEVDSKKFKRCKIGLSKGFKGT